MIGDKTEVTASRQSQAAGRDIHNHDGFSVEQHQAILNAQVNTLFKALERAHSAAPAWRVCGGALADDDHGRVRTRVWLWAMCWRRCWRWPRHETRCPCTHACRRCRRWSCSSPSSRSAFLLPLCPVLSLVALLQHVGHVGSIGGGEAARPSAAPKPQTLWLPTLCSRA